MNADMRQTSGDREEADAWLTPLEIAQHEGVPRHRVIPMANRLGIVPERVGSRRDRVYTEEQAMVIREALREEDRLIRSRRILRETCRLAAKVHGRKADALQAGGVCG